MNSDDNYPLNCIDDTGDGFSGWFAVSNSRSCNDFCYWQVVVVAPPRTPPSSEGEGANSAMDTKKIEEEDAATYHSWNTANPHIQSVIYYRAKKNRNETDSAPVAAAYWTCLFNVADDKITVSNAGTGQRWMDVWQEYVSSTTATTNMSRDDDHDVKSSNGFPFPYLRCQKGASEQLITWSSTAIKSATFYEGLVVLIALIFSGEVATILMWMVRKRRMVSRYAQVGVLDGAEQEETVGVVVGIVGAGAGQISSLQIDEEPLKDNHQVVQRMNVPRCKYCAPCATSRRRLSTKHIFRTLLLLLFNLLLTITLSFVSISLMEIQSNPHFTESMQVLTPACSDPTLVCPAGNEDIDRPTAVVWSQNRKSGPRRMEDKSELATQATIAANNDNATNITSPNYQHQRGLMQPFSYIIASDAQLYWFNGEFSEMGQKPIPSSCSPSDSCGRCTAKHGLNTNLRLKKAWESLMTGATDGMRERNHATNSTATVDSDDLPIPSTLVMNGERFADKHLSMHFDSSFTVVICPFKSEIILKQR